MTSDKKKTDAKAGDHAEKKKTDAESSSYSDLNHKGTLTKLWLSLIAILVAVGAYSKGSLFVRYLIPAKTFSIVKSTSIGGTANTGIFRAYHTKFGELLAPV